MRRILKIALRSAVISVFCILCTGGILGCAALMALIGSVGGSDWITAIFGLIGLTIGCLEYIPPAAGVIRAILAK